MLNSSSRRTRPRSTTQPCLTSGIFWWPKTTLALAHGPASGRGVIGHMPRDVARDALYSGQINLWVEDCLTRAYLDALWNDSAVKFLIGGGRDGVGAILKDAEDAGYTNVFGVIDRDFEPSNQSDWMDPAKTSRRFVVASPRDRILPS